ncbi:MAG TPA: site-specific integrase [Myxococcota bacterium]|nr:site-specific integrase [Myxococcota bacterium]
MLERYFLQPTTIDRIRASWLAGPIEQYVAWLTERSYRPGSIIGRVPLLMQFGDFARSRGAKSIQDLPAQVDAFVESRLSRDACSDRSAQALHVRVRNLRSPVEQMLKVILQAEADSIKPVRMPFACEAPGFFPHLRDERGLQETTIRLYAHHLGRFEDHVASTKLDGLSGLNPAVLESFVVAIGRRVCPAAQSAVCSALRHFCRYLHREGVVERDLSSLVGHPQVYRLSTIPRSISSEDVGQVLDSVDCRSKVGKRDYAMLLLMVLYGLRAREVAALTLDDIDWRAEKIHIRERKAGHSSVYPLSVRAGDALLSYLKHARPETAERSLFFRMVAPRGPVTYTIVSDRATHYLKKAGIQVHRPGSHTLRHSCAQRLVDADFSFKVIGDYLGHSSPSSTEIYTKVAIEALREVALGDGEAIA